MYSQFHILSTLINTMKIQSVFRKSIFALYLRAIQSYLFKILFLIETILHSNNYLIFPITNIQNSLDQSTTETRINSKSYRNVIFMSPPS